VAAKPPCAFGNALAKFDVRDGEAVLWHEGGAIPGEPVMVPRPGAQARSHPCMPCCVRSAQASRICKGKAACDTVLDFCCASAGSTRLLLSAAT